MTRDYLQARVENWLIELWPKLVDRQRWHFGTHGCYWQGLRTHNLLPPHTDTIDADAVPDALDAKPTDGDTPWRLVFPLWTATQLPCALEMNVYHSEQGHGWVATVYVQHNGQIFARSRNFGPETHRDTPWRRLQTEVDAA